MRSIVLLLISICAWSQTARFPGAIATNNDLTDIADRAQTTLTAPLNTSATSFTVVSGSKFTPNMILSIDFEQVKICSVVGNTLNVGHSSCPNADGRGFAGTSAASHITGSLVSNFVVAYNFKALREEVKAIETALGPNLANSASVVNPASYNFTPQAPGVSLTGGQSNTIVMAPCPPGVAGNHTHHWLYIQGGTGTAEPVLISGGGCNSGDLVGTIIFTPQFSHTGAWTIGSATAGATEACAVNTPCLLYIGGGTDWYGTFWSPGRVSFQGAGLGISIIRWHNLNSKMFDVERDNFRFDGIRILQVGTPTAGSIGIYLAGNGSGVSGAAANDAQITNFDVWGFYNGIWLAGGGGAIDLSHGYVRFSVADGMTSLSSQGKWDAIISEFNGGNGFLNGQASPGGGWPPWMNGIETFGNAGWGLVCNIYCQVSNQSFFNNDQLGGIHVTCLATVCAENGYITNTWIQYEGQAYPGAPWSTNAVAPGIVIDPNTGPISLSDVHFYANEGNHIVNQGNSATITNCRFFIPGAGGVTDHFYSILQTTPANSAIITNNHFDHGVNRIDGNRNIVTGNIFTSGGFAAATLWVSTGVDLTFEGNTFEQGGLAYQLDAGVTVKPGNNSVPVGSVINNASISGFTQPTTTTSAQYFYALDTGSAFNIKADIPGVSIASHPIITIKLANLLGGGTPNTLTFNGAAFFIRSARNHNNEIATGYDANGTITLQHDGTYWIDLSQ